MGKPVFKVMGGVCLWVLTCILLASTVQAAGFGIYEWSARGNAMGGALIATQDADASAIAYNPATMTQIDDAAVLVGSSLIAPKFEVERAGSSFTNKSQLFAVPHAYGVAKAADKVWIGFGEYTRFGLGTRYDQSWSGKRSLYDVQFATFEGQPTIAFQATEDLSIGVGVELFYGTIDLKKFTESPLAPGVLVDTRMRVDGFAVGANLSAYYQINDQWAAGFVYRSPMDLHGSGTVKFTPGNPLGLSDGPMTLDATLPASYSLGLSYKPTEAWSIELDAIYTQWELYKKMTFGFSAATGLPTESESIKHWKNVWRMQLGTEYAATDWLDLRAGYIWDQSPIRQGHADYMLPSNDRMLFSGGLGFHFLDNWTVDAYYVYLKGKDRKGVKITENAVVGTITSDFKGAHANIGALSIGYEF